jgi:hypothetical protein
LENESSGLLMFHGLLLVGLVCGRRKWVAALLAVVALSRSGLSAITEWIGLPKARATSTAPPPESTSRLMARVGSPSAPAERTYAGLLRRLAGDAASASLRTLITATNQEPATRLAWRAQVAGSVVPVALTGPAARIPAATEFAFVPSEGRVLFPLQTLSFALFARPPPATA